MALSAIGPSPGLNQMALPALAYTSPPISVEGKGAMMLSCSVMQERKLQLEATAARQTKTQHPSCGVHITANACN